MLLEEMWKAKVVCPVVRCRLRAVLRVSAEKFGTVAVRWPTRKVRPEWQIAERTCGGIDMCRDFPRELNEMTLGKVALVT